MKKCNSCFEEFDKDSLPIYLKTRTKCLPCFKEYKSEKDRSYRDRYREKIKEKKKEYYENGGKEKVCPCCGISHKKPTTKYCSKKCFHEESKTSRQGKGNPVWKNAKHPQTYNKLYFDSMYKEKGLLPEEIGCEVCSRMAGTIFDRHHIVFKSEKYKHTELNNPRNIIQVCRSCHLMFHSKKIKRKKYIEERKLEDLFGCKLE